MDTRRISSRVATCVAAYLAHGCAPQPATRHAELAADSARLADQTATVVALFTDVSPDAAPERAASTAAAQIATQFRPLGCTRTAVAGAVATIEFTRDCLTVVNGLFLDGTVVAMYATGANGLSVTLDGSALRQWSQPLAIRATATIAGAAGARVARVSSSSRGAGDHVASLTQTGTFTVRSDGACVGIDGDFTLDTDADHFAGTLDAYQRCDNECPRGGVLALTAGGVTTRLVFAGGQLGTATSDDGQSAFVTLRCTSASQRDR